MSLRLPVKMCFWDQTFAYLLRDAPSSLIVCIKFMKRVIPVGHVFKRSSDPYMFPTF